MIVLIVIQLSACNTLRGAGKDIEKNGETIQKSTNQLVRNLPLLTLTLILSTITLSVFIQRLVM